MCGIVGYLGEEKARPILLQGLARLEYRGYDSVGIFVRDAHTDHVVKTVGKVADLRVSLEDYGECNGTLGIAHTRWATHGEPTQYNAHPHYSNSKEIVLVHNSIKKRF